MTFSTFEAALPASPLAFFTPSTRMFSASAAQASSLAKDCVPQIVTSCPASLVSSFAALARILSSDAVIAPGVIGGALAEGSAGEPETLWM